MARVQIKKAREELRLLNEMVDALMQTVGQITVSAGTLDRVATEAERPGCERRRDKERACSPRS